MLRYAANENFNNDILRVLRRRDDRIDVVRVQDVEFSATPTSAAFPTCGGVTGWRPGETEGCAPRHSTTGVSLNPSCSGCPGQLAASWN